MNTLSKKNTQSVLCKVSPKSMVNCVLQELYNQGYPFVTLTRYKEVANSKNFDYLVNYSIDTLHRLNANKLNKNKSLQRFSTTIK